MSKRKRQRLYIVLQADEEKILPTSEKSKIRGGHILVRLSWADGQVGAIPVFTNKRKAQRYAKRLGALIQEAYFEEADE